MTKTSSTVYEYHPGDIWHAYPNEANRDDEATYIYIIELLDRKKDRYLVMEMKSGRILSWFLPESNPYWIYEKVA